MLRERDLRLSGNTSLKRTAREAPIELAAQSRRRHLRRDAIVDHVNDPPIAPEPKRMVAGPRTISMLWLSKGLTLGAWSGLKFETSKTSVPSLRTRTRLSARPRMIGRLAPGLKPLAATPGWLASVSPRLAAAFCFTHLHSIP